LHANIRPFFSNKWGIDLYSTSMPLFHRPAPFTAENRPIAVESRRIDAETDNTIGYRGCQKNVSIFRLTIYHRSQGIAADKNISKRLDIQLA